MPAETASNSARFAVDVDRALAQLAIVGAHSNTQTLASLDRSRRGGRPAAGAACSAHTLASTARTLRSALPEAVPRACRSATGASGVLLRRPASCTSTRRSGEAATLRSSGGVQLRLRGAVLLASRSAGASRMDARARATAVNTCDLVARYKGAARTLMWLCDPVVGDNDIACARCPRAWKGTKQQTQVGRFCIAAPCQSYVGGPITAQGRKQTLENLGIKRPWTVKRAAAKMLTPLVNTMISEYEGWQCPFCEFAMQPGCPEPAVQRGVHLKAHGAKGRELISRRHSRVADDGRTAQAKLMARTGQTFVAQRAATLRQDFLDRQVRLLQTQPSWACRYSVEGLMAVPLSGGRKAQMVPKYVCPCGHITKSRLARGLQGVVCTAAESAVQLAARLRSKAELALEFAAAVRDVNADDEERRMLRLRLRRVALGMARRQY